MADMNFAVNLLPTSETGYNLGSSAKTWENIYGRKIILKNTVSYDTSLPGSGTQGQLFFLIIN